jgi:uncharacterized coiled-coil DUF342 family protein
MRQLKEPDMRYDYANLSEENHAQELLITELKARVKELEEELASMREHRDELMQRVRDLKQTA